MKEMRSLRRFHAPVWSEPLIMEMGSPGERGILVPESDDEIKATVGDAESYIPSQMRRHAPPKLPELSQPQVLRHYLRLSQENLGMEENIEIGTGTATMKYSPKVNEMLVRLPQMTEIHPLQNEQTLQGVLEIIYQLDLFLREISGLDQFIFQPSGGSLATFTNACLFRTYCAGRGELAQRDEIITTIFSHPCNSATARAAGFKVITLMPDEGGYPDFEALKAVCSNRTAGLMITNPEDTGIYNPKIKAFTELVHAFGGLCFYDQANANGLLGVTRAKEAGFDACHFNLHKTFSSPHGSFGPGCAGYGVTEKLAKYLPAPVVTFDGHDYHLDYARPHSIGKVTEFFGNIPAVVRAYSWIRSLGPEGLLESSRVAVMNNNYLSKLLLEIPGVVRYYDEDNYRLELTRLSWEKLKEDTGCGTDDVRRRMTDFGLQGHFMSHRPWIVPEPFTPEPCETYSKEDIDYFAAVLNQISHEAYTNPEVVRTAPHNATTHKPNSAPFNDPKKWAMTWRAYLRKNRGQEFSNATPNAGPVEGKD
jgi:glycine dehydrogenase subunit 2